MADADIESYQKAHSKVKQAFFDYVLPSPWQLIFWLLVSTVILVVINFGSFWGALVGTLAGSVTPTDVQPITDRVVEFQAKLGTPLTMLFWGVLGAISFGIIWLFQTVHLIVRKQKAESQYLTGGIFQQPDYWRRTMSRDIFFGLVLAAWIIFVVVYFKYILPQSSEAFVIGLYQSTASETMVHITGAVALHTFGVYIAVMLKQAMSDLWRSLKPED